MKSHRASVRLLLSGITGNTEAAKVVNEAVYIQHNPRTATGGPGLADLFTRLGKQNPQVEFIRVFQDGDFGFAHNRYIFGGKPEVAFEVFRFEEGLAVEHWDNLESEKASNNASGRGMLDGQVEIEDLDKTETHRDLARTFVETVLVGDSNTLLEDLGKYVVEDLIQHDPRGADGVDAFRASLTGDNPRLCYNKLHRVLAEGNFVLCMCEGMNDGVASGLYSLFRFSNDKIVEHWITIDAIAPLAEWKNNNGKF